ncbi:hypothetical protein LTR62_004674 [Meristemomyces frigidus]|uniref:Uncharacterized protein n=1 Tax=Meristemomyces frigidus TaxID=1508187 RepID=A0AAN7YNY4_9PEZI|nr:hypothetical protein LTR62_004674 [Meristemomyces frigidus]
MPRVIKDFFKPYIVPRNKVPEPQAEAEQIVVRPVSKQKDACGSSKKDTPSKHKAKISPQKSQLSRESSLSSLPALTPLEPTSQSPHKHSNVPSLSGSNDDDQLYHSSPTASIQRTVKAVKVPSPRRIISRSPTPTPAPASRSQPSMAPPPPNTSFISAASSTLSSVPLSSQSSSKRIMKHGMQAVTNSDSGSAEDSDEELADLDVLFPRKKMKLTPPPPPAATIDTARSRNSVRLSDDSFKSRTHTPQFNLPPSPPRTEYKHSLFNLVEAHEKAVQQEARLAAIETEVSEAARKKEDAAEAESNMLRGEQMGLVEKYAGNDSDGGEGVMAAMMRTEALLEEDKFFFFRSGTQQPKSWLEAFPSSSVVGSPMASIFTDEKHRQQAFVTGFVADLALMGKLPDAVVRWVGGQIVHERREDLREAYVELLKVSKDHGFVMGAKSLQDMYSTVVPASVDAEVRAESPLSELSAVDGEVEDMGTGLTTLRHVVRALPCLHSNIDLAALAYAVLDLALLNIDSNHSLDVALHTEIDHAFEQLMAPLQFSELETLCSSIAASLHNIKSLSPGLRCRVVSSLPATTEQTHFLRRQLALCCVLNTWQDESIPIPEAQTAVLERLRSSPDFIINSTTDYGLLMNMTSVLDIAIDAGFCSDFSFLTHPVASMRADPLDKVAIKSFFTKTTAPTISAAQKHFDRQVDEISSQLRLMASRIKDSGATNLRRAECKAMVEMLCLRLDHSVRTRPRRKNDVFSSGGGGSAWSRSTFGGSGKNSKPKMEGEVPIVRIADGLEESQVEHAAENDGRVRPSIAMGQGDLPIPAMGVGRDA